MTDVSFTEDVPDGLGGTLLVYDRVLDSNDAFPALRRGFTAAYPVEGGEQLKELASFPAHAETILGLVADVARDDITLAAAGGGSVGDFGGFVASVVRRGVRFVNVPTTWLAAIDSAHGGKTALNAGGFKNQIGTFHPAAEVVVVRRLLEGAPHRELESAYGELVKMAMLTGGDLLADLDSSGADTDLVWRLLPRAVAAKQAVVDADPFETTGHRRILNLGHTVGHALEAVAGLPHGIAVGHGLRFAVEWSRRRGHLADAEAQRLRELVRPFPAGEVTIGADELAAAVTRDKKAAGGGKVAFVFLEGAGRPLIEVVTVGEVVEEAVRQGWV